MSVHTRATRFHIDSTERLPSGALLVRGNLTKTGVFNYQFGEDIVRELRSEEEVFASSALDSLLGAPVTIDHPAAFVDNTNHAVLSVGVVRKVEQAAPYVQGEMRIHDTRTIDMIQAKKLAEVSLGYATEVVAIDSGEADFAQTDIVYNHAALGPPGWGRLGTDVALTLDAAGNLDFAAFRMDRELEEHIEIARADYVAHLTALLNK